MNDESEILALRARTPNTTYVNFKGPQQLLGPKGIMLQHADEMLFIILMIRDPMSNIVKIGVNVHSNKRSVATVVAIVLICSVLLPPSSVSLIKLKKIDKRGAPQNGTS